MLWRTPFSHPDLLKWLRSTILTRVGWVHHAQGAET